MEKGFTKSKLNGKIRIELAQGIVVADSANVETAEWWKMYQALCKMSKPYNARNVKRWIKRGGQIRIDLDKNVWTYSIREQGENFPVDYVNGEPNFTKYAKAEIAAMQCTGNRGKDRKEAERRLQEEGREPPQDCECHHVKANDKMQWIPKWIHRLFTHAGGVAESQRMKKNNYSDSKK